MSDTRGTNITHVLQLAAAGDQQAAASLLPLVYDELRGIARAHLARQRAGHTLQPTALVHEAYLRLVGKADPGWNGRGHFFSAAATAMRHILIDAARGKAAVKRGGGRERVELDEGRLPIASPVEDLLALDEALKDLERSDPRKGQVVLLRYYGGLTHEEIAEILEVSVPTVEREWRFARSFLHARLANPALDA